MDKQEFSRRAFADPRDDSPEFHRAIEQDRDNAALFEELTRLNSTLDAALNIDVPQTLAARLHALPQQQPATQGPVQERNKVVKPAFGLWRIAASLALVAGLSAGMMHFIPAPVAATDLASHAIEHTLYGQRFAGVIHENISLQTVNAKLASIDGQLTEQIGEIHWASNCEFEGVKSLHLVVAGEKGNINLFLVPNTQSFKVLEDFSDQQLKGHIEPGPKGHVVIIGELEEPLEKINHRINNSLNWRA